MSPSKEVIKALPKVELHSHLHGNIRQSTLQSLLEEKKKTRPVLQGVSFAPFEILDSRDLDKCFSYFDTVYKVVDDAESVEKITREVLQDYAAENVKYLELRTTPRECLTTGLSKEKYCDIVVSVIQELSPSLGMTVRLILSINRAKHGGEQAESLAEAAVKEIEVLSRRHPGVVVGVDIAGNPQQGDVTALLSVLQRRGLCGSGSGAGLKLTVHTGEVEAAEEVDAILNSGPARLGHACCMSDEQRRKVIEGGFHVEFCPSSNFFTMRMKSMQDHHVSDFVQDGLRNLSFNCDDTGLFRTDLTSELFSVGQAFGLSDDDLFLLQKVAVKAAFPPVSSKADTEKGRECESLLEAFSNEAFEKAAGRPLAYGGEEPECSPAFWESIRQSFANPPKEGETARPQHHIPSPEGNGETEPYVAG
uniref:Adenosine deaminase domain-containing protein n=1 Tax=Chromera velia CCMP2878 TaxID=1169474 RepID=A0A0G4FUG6_9ALVE|eukprot:Cvel_18710.t1-p1 / transcript=Cvel_18710.t1 / gene=Cvel_18710 / organism=Chromera_velia_CCMP2878 / gene_product=Adenosine deaminase-like protein, putative / transcript_product=Adenosine deaminase-like protein, putative / location=Cvel_scaffold1568:10837-15952(+) / protein_length=419 / sequence_SO=supercontig / SO=protein_coding / is_pseudo=false